LNSFAVKLLRIKISKGVAATDLRQDSRFYYSCFFNYSSTNATVQELLKSIHICRGNRKNKIGTFLWTTVHISFSRPVFPSESYLVISGVAKGGTRVHGLCPRTPLGRGGRETTSVPQTSSFIPRSKFLATPLLVIRFLNIINVQNRSLYRC